MIASSTRMGAQRTAYGGVPTQILRFAQNDKLSLSNDKLFAQNDKQFA